MGKTRNLQALDNEWKAFTNSLPPSDALDASVIAFTEELAKFPLSGDKGALRPQHVLPAFFDAVKGQQKTFSHADFMESLAENGLPALDAASLEPFRISLKGDKAVVLSPEQLVQFRELMEPFVRSFAAHSLLQQEKRAVSSTSKEEKPFINRAWFYFDKCIPEKSDLLKTVTDLKSAVDKHNVRPLEAFDIATELLNRTSKETKGTDESFHYLSLLAHAGEKGSLPKIGKTEVETKFPNGLKIHNRQGEEITLSGQDIYQIYEAARKVAPAYGAARIIPLRNIPERDVAVAEGKDIPSAPLFKKPTIDAILAGHAAGAAASVVKEHIASGAEKQPDNHETTAGATDGKKPDDGKEAGDTDKTNKITKFLFGTTGGKITVAAAAVAIVSTVLAVMLGNKQNQQAGLGR